jgi:hypothetical protein
MPSPTFIHSPLARWAYSELLTRSEYQYLDDIQNLRSRRAQGAAFDGLNQRDLDRLVEAWNRVRGDMGRSVFALALRDVRTFRLIEWTEAQLGATHVIPYFVMEIGQPRQGLVTFRQWIEADPIRPLHQTHARYALYGALPPGPCYPAIAGQLGGVQRLLDGYHRAVRFWYGREVGATIQVWEPVADQEVPSGQI